MTAWYDLRERVQKNKIIDKVAKKKMKKEKDHWKKLLQRIIYVVEFLAKHNLPFRGKKQRLYQNNNGNFLGLIEMLAKFDPIIQEHVLRITNAKIHFHYPGHNIQNELILLIASIIKAEIIKNVKEAKYFSVILDCTPNISPQEQMSLILIYVDVTSNSICVQESFLGFLNVDDTTGQENVPDPTLKPLSSTRWESRVESVTAIRFQIAESSMYGLISVQVDSGFGVKLGYTFRMYGQVSIQVYISKITSKAKSLAKNELGDFDFLVALVIWHEILFRVNYVSKSLQSHNMVLDISIEDIRKLILFLEEYRESGFLDALSVAKNIVIELNVDPVFPER
ncbi:uncharacterized protein LOC141588168 [Silene latifolia]|uniref:uncharacterized protein LOC141588168 n=1 Tax=Silene latifolia TaxID=37657 RepID=UPI003D776FCB